LAAQAADRHRALASTLREPAEVDSATMHADVDNSGSALNVIVVEDSELDYELLLAMLMREGLRPRAVRVEDEAGMREAFARGRVDAVITDHNLPRFDSFASLKVAKSVDSDIPVIVLSGEMSEELAVAALHAGADDFVLKTRMFRIASALQNSLRAAESRREAHAAVAALADSEARLHALTQHLERAKEDERRAIAQEIHDDIGGALTALKFELVRLSREMEARDGERSTRLDGIQELLESAVIASHRIQHALRPAVLDAGLVAALEWLTRGFSERSGLAVEFQSNCDEFEIEPDRAAALYRVAQEALTNVRKHARSSSSVQLQLFALADEVTLEVTDDGPGFDTGSLEVTAGFGVRGMMERARGFGGWAEVSSAPGRGTTVMFSIPPKQANGGDGEPRARERGE
jgi:signal transduction histidine kinase